MNPRKVILFLVAVAIAIALSFLVSGCTTTTSGIPTEVASLDDGCYVIDVPEFGFMFDAGKWWVAERNRRSNEVMPVTLTNAVYGAQVLVTALSSDGSTLHDLAWEAYAHESRGEHEVSTMRSADHDHVRYMWFSHVVGHESTGRVQERIAFVASDVLPDVQFTFYGTWMEDDEDDVGSQMEVMIESLRPMPPEYLRRWKEGLK